MSLPIASYFSVIQRKLPLKVKCEKLGWLPENGLQQRQRGRRVLSKLNGLNCLFPVGHSPQGETLPLPLDASPRGQHGPAPEAKAFLGVKLCLYRKELRWFRFQTLAQVSTEARRIESDFQITPLPATLVISTATGLQQHHPWTSEM